MQRQVMVLPMTLQLSTRPSKLDLDVIWEARPQVPVNLPQIHPQLSISLQEPLWFPRPSSSGT